MVDCCEAWEAAANKGTELGLRVVKIRVGIVPTKDGGALPTMEKTVKYFIGAPLGSGKQWMPWIHMNDIVNIFIKTTEDENMQGTYNGCAPNPVTNKTFTKVLGKGKGKPIWPIHVPEFMLKVILGEMSILPLISTNTSAQKIVNSGSSFEFEKLEDALRDIYN